MLNNLPSIGFNAPQDPNNPSDSQRHNMLYNALLKAGRPEDYTNIVSLLSPPNDITSYGVPGAKKDIKVGIVGGGLAGMSTAFELRKLGFDVTVFEPNTERVGGRVYTYYFDEDKRLYDEFGAMRFPVSHEAVWHYINLFKLNTEAFIQYAPNTFTYVRDVRVRNDPKGENIRYQIYPKFNLTTIERNTPWPKLFNQAIAYSLSTLPPDVRKEFLMILQKYDFRIESLMKMSTRQALQEYGLSAEAINLTISVMPLLGSVINSGYEGALNDNYTMDYSNLYRISGGMVNLPLAFYKSLTSPNPVEYPNIPQDAIGKVNWKGGTLATGVYKSDVNGKVIISYTILPHTKESFETFDYVIFATPMSVLRGLTIRPLFNGEKMQAIKEIIYQDAQKTLFLCKERFWEKQGITGGMSITDKIIATIHYPQDHAYCMQNTAYCSPDEPGVLLASYNIDQDALRLGMELQEYRYAFIKKDVELVHGLPRGYLDNIVMDNKTVDWYKELWFYGAFQMFLPGQRESFLYTSSTPEYNNRVFFAGEHISPKNAWIQGALHSGMVAANSLAYYSGIHSKQA